MTCRLCTKAKRFHKRHMFDWIGVKKVQVLPASPRLTRCLMSDTEATDTTMKCRVGRSEKSLAK